MWELRRRRVHSSKPSSGAPAEIARQGFSDRPSGFFKVPRTRSEPFPNAAEIGRDIEFLTVKAGFGPPKRSCRHDVSCLN